jgi:hypothetical protein
VLTFVVVKVLDDDEVALVVVDVFVAELDVVDGQAVGAGAGVLGAYGFKTDLMKL